MTTAIVHHPVFEKHDTGPGHPETPERYATVMAALRGDSELWSEVIEIEADEARRSEIQSCHSPQHYKHVERVVNEGTGFLAAPPTVSVHSLDAALRGAGAACRAVDALMEGEASTAFVPVRPPGHHATPDRAMGFCLFNNVGVAARYAQSRHKEIERVAIIDWDVHHGNGTQGIFYDDPSVYYFSMHQYPWYPGTGTRSETGHGRGRGYTLNVPLRAMTPVNEQRRAFDSAIGDMAAEFTPDLIMLSAGFDAHESDPLEQVVLQNADFVQMTSVRKQWANESCAGRIVSCMEGGYNLETLGDTVRSHVKELKEE